MRSIIITSLNDNGDRALKQHMTECSRMSRKNKMIFKVSGYKQELVSQSPYQICLTVNNPLLENVHTMAGMVDTIERALTCNLAEKNVDYTIEVK